MSDSDENITHVFDQTNGVLDGFEGGADGSSEAAATDAAQRRGDATHDLTPGTDDSARGASTGEEHAFAVDARGTATDADDRRPGSGGGAHAATAADTTAVDHREQAAEPTDVQRSEIAQPPVDHDHDHAGHDHDHADHDHDHDHAGHDHPAPATAPAAAGSDESIAHVFDQTNGVIEGVEGESDGTAAGDEASSADRHGLNEPNPVGQQDAWRDDHYGAEDGRDRNP